MKVGYALALNIFLVAPSLAQVLCENPNTVKIAKSIEYSSNESELLNEEEKYDRMMALALAYTSVQRFKNKTRLLVNENDWLVNQRIPVLLDPYPIKQGDPPYFGKLFFN